MLRARGARENFLPQQVVGQAFTPLEVAWLAGTLRSLSRFRAIVSMASEVADAKMTVDAWRPSSARQRGATRGQG